MIHLNCVRGVTYCHHKLQGLRKELPIKRTGVVLIDKVHKQTMDRQQQWVSQTYNKGQSSETQIYRR